MTDEQDQRVAEGERMARLEKEVEMLRNAVERLTDIVVRGSGALLATGVLGAITGLILKGVIG
jgi:hypothetical protein